MFVSSLSVSSPDGVRPSTNWISSYPCDANFSAYPASTGRRAAARSKFTFSITVFCRFLAFCVYWARETKRRFWAQSSDHPRHLLGKIWARNQSDRSWAQLGPSLVLSQSGWAGPKQDGAGPKIQHASIESQSKWAPGPVTGK